MNVATDFKRAQQRTDEMKKIFNHPRLLRIKELMLF